MSFSSDVKEELAKQISKSRHCQLAELAGIIELSGRINEKTKGLELDTENLLLLNKYATLMKRAFGTDTTKALDEQETGKILAALKITAQPVNCQQTDCRRTASYADMLQESLYQGSLHGSRLDKRPQQSVPF